MASNLFMMDPPVEDQVDVLRKSFGNARMHCTDGSFALRSGTAVPMTIAGFRSIQQTFNAVKGEVFIVAVSSDATFGKEPAANSEASTAGENQWQRLEKVCIPLAQRFTDKNIVGLFFDDATPARLYDAMAKEGLNLASLHRHGADVNSSPIPGADHFERVFAFPQPGDTSGFHAGRTSERHGNIEIMPLYYPVLAPSH